MCQLLVYNVFQEKQVLYAKSYKICSSKEQLSKLSAMGGAMDSLIGFISK